MIEVIVIIIFSVVSTSMFLIAAYYGFKEIIDEFYDLSNPIEEPIPPDSKEQAQQI